MTDMAGMPTPAAADDPVPDGAVVVGLDGSAKDDAVLELRARDFNAERRAGGWQCSGGMIASRCGLHSGGVGVRGHGVLRSAARQSKGGECEEVDETHGGRAGKSDGFAPLRPQAAPVTAFALSNDVLPSLNSRNRPVVEK